MAYDFQKWVENEGFGRRSVGLRWTYAAPFLLFPASLVIDFGDGFGSPWLAVLGSLLAVAAILCSMLIMRSPFLRELWRSATSRPGAKLDERERLAIGEALAQSYLLLGAMVIAALTYADLAPGFDLWLPSADDVETLKFPLFAMIVVLPVAIAEWSVPLPPEDGED